MSVCEIGARLGGGGMGEVLLGRWRGRLVAIKRLVPHLAEDPSRRAMFLDEARLAAQVHHRNVVPTLDVLEDDGAPIIVMEYVEGASLASILGAARRSGQKMPVAIATAILSDVLAGLHAAHETTGAGGRPLDIVHRDVSPQNVIVGRDGVARIIDFGIARASERSVHTRSGEVKGKLGYMPPEQLRGRAVDRRADVYAAGAVLWECLTSRRFRPGSDLEVLEQIQMHDVDPPSRFAPVPIALDDVVLAATATAPEDRPATAAAMAHALRAAAPPASATEVAEWMERLVGDELAARAALVQAEATKRASPKRARGLLVTALAATLVAGTGALVLARQAPVRAALAPATNAAIAPAPPPAIAPPPETAEPAAPPPATTTTSPPHRPTTRKAAPARIASDPCKVPFVIDEEGNRKYKRECLK